jgi:hypothetical protein
MTHSSSYYLGAFLFVVAVAFAIITWYQWTVQNTPCDDQDCDKIIIPWTVPLGFTIGFGLISLVFLSQRGYIDINEYRKKRKSPYSLYRYRN